MKTFNLFTLMTLALTVAAAPQDRVRRQTDDPQTALCLEPSVIAQGFKNNGNPDVANGETPSRVSSNNFINFCFGHELTDGKQKKGGSCNPAPIGSIPSSDKMPSLKFKFPLNLDESLTSNTPFSITMIVKNLATGNFVNAQRSYFAAPQDLDLNGIIVGHSHVVIEKLDSFQQTTPTNPNEFVFFKGVNTEADANGEITIQVDKGLATGVYRMCSINSSSNHQPVIVPVAQHGSLDDCVYFSVSPAGLQKRRRLFL